MLVPCHAFYFVIYFPLHICYPTTIDLRRKRISDFSPRGWHSRILLGNFSNTFLDDREIVKKQKLAIIKEYKKVFSANLGMGAKGYRAQEGLASFQGGEREAEKSQKEAKMGSIDTHFDQ